jgi:hypothetical protein
MISSCRPALSLSAFVLALALVASPSVALEIIDSFDDTIPGGVLDALVAPNPNTTTQTGLGSTIGGQRYVEEFLSVGVGSGTSIGLPGSGTVSHSNGPAEISSQTYIYGLSSALNADLSGESAFLITDVDGLDLSDIVATLVWTVDLSILVESGAGSAMSTQTLSADGDYLFPFSAFGGVDFSDVDKITFLYDDPAGFAGGAGADYTLTNMLAVPEPSTALMLGLGLIGLTLRTPRAQR